MRRRSFLQALAGVFALLPITEAVAKGGRGGAKSSRSGGASSYRSAKTGRYVKKSYADKNRNTTVKERRK